jgi:hypothetical protein
MDGDPVRGQPLGCRKTRKILAKLLNCAGYTTPPLTFLAMQTFFPKASNQPIDGGVSDQ